MAKKPVGTAPQEQFAKMPRTLMESDAWRSLGINERRVVDFLLIEHMSHGGRKNGALSLRAASHPNPKAPRAASTPAWAGAIQPPCWLPRLRPRGETGAG